VRLSFARHDGWYAFVRVTVWFCLNHCLTLSRRATCNYEMCNFALYHNVNTMPLLNLARTFRYC
jgi:hypothetical protein